MREVPTIMNIILDGNSIPAAYGTDLDTQLTALYGAGNYRFTNISVGGQTIDNGTANCMQGRINQFLINNIRGFSVINVLLFQEIRNEMFVNGSTPAQAVAKAVTYCNTVRAALPSHVNIDIRCITPIADDDTGLDIDTARGLIIADSSGAWDGYFDLFAQNNGGTGTFTSDNPPPTVTSGNAYYSGGSYDGTHPNATGRAAAGLYLANQIYALYP